MGFTSLENLVAVFMGKVGIITVPRLRRCDIIEMERPVKPAEKLRESVCTRESQIEIVKVGPTQTDCSESTQNSIYQPTDHFYYPIQRYFHVESLTIFMKFQAEFVKIRRLFKLFILFIEIIFQLFIICFFLKESEFVYLLSQCLFYLFFSLQVTLIVPIIL